MLIDMNTGPVEMVPGTRQTVWNSEDDLWYNSWISPSGVRLYRPALAHKQEDGSWAVRVGDDYSNEPDWWAPVHVDEPAPEPEPVTGLSVATFFPDDVQKVKNAASFVKSPKRMMGSLLYREPEHGHWYESGWMWFFLGLTALCALIWFGPMGALAEAQASMSDPDADTFERMVFWGAWMFVGWMPLAASGIGALQKEGYKRLAAAYSIVLFVLFSWFMHSQTRDADSR
jgi:hypothetical protein